MYGRAAPPCLECYSWGCCVVDGVDSKYIQCCSLIYYITSRGGGRRAGTCHRPEAFLGPGFVELGEAFLEPGEAFLEPGEALLEPGEAVLEPGEAVLAPRGGGGRFSIGVSNSDAGTLSARGGGVVEY